MKALDPASDAAPSCRRDLVAIHARDRSSRERR
jgi:hypothetical protein